MIEYCKTDHSCSRRGIHRVAKQSHMEAHLPVELPHFHPAELAALRHSAAGSFDPYFVSEVLHFVPEDLHVVEEDRHFVYQVQSLLYPLELC